MSKKKIAYLVMRVNTEMSVYPFNPAYNQKFPKEIAGVCFVFNDKEEAIKYSENEAYKIYAVSVTEPIESSIDDNNRGKK